VQGAPFRSAITKALLDGDIYAYRSAAASENDDLGIAIHRLEEMIDLTLHAVQADEFMLFLSGEGNFRYQVYPEYKANRHKLVRPRHLTDLKDYLVTKYQAQVSEGCEADDLLGVEQCKSENTIICSLDKDLRQIPGKHYSFEIRGATKSGPWTKPAEFATVTEAEGLRFFYYQLLVGDVADNLTGVRGIGPVKANAILSGCNTERDLFEAVESQYSSLEELEMMGKCLWIWHKENDIWRLPTFDTEQREGERPKLSAANAGLDSQDIPAAGA
jgi:5'-3' exonuclease